MKETEKKIVEEKEKKRKTFDSVFFEYYLQINKDRRVPNWTDAFSISN